MKEQKALPPSSGKMKFLRNLRYTRPMIKDYRSGKYGKFPWKALAGTLLAVLYVFFPFDIVPDFILGFGLIDDAAITLLSLKAIDMDIQDYKNWLSEQESLNEKSFEELEK